MNGSLLLNSADVPQPEIAKLPAHVDRKEGADLVRRFYFKVSPRSLERWPLGWRVVNGRATCPTIELLMEARRRFDAAPIIRGGRTLGKDSIARRMP
jgi:hypothetical protein